MKNREIAALLIEVCKRRRNKKNQLLSAANIYEGQDLLLCKLSHKDGQTMTELAENICIQPATLSVTIRRMEANGLIAKKTNDTDKRISHIHMTEKGREIWSTSRQVWNEMETLTTKGFSEAEKDALKDMLQRMANNLE